MYEGIIEVSYSRDLTILRLNLIVVKLALVWMTKIMPGNRVVLEDKIYMPGYTTKGCSAMKEPGEKSNGNGGGGLFV